MSDISLILCYLGSMVAIQPSCQCDDICCTHDCIVQVDLSRNHVDVQYYVLDRRDTFVCDGYKVKRLSRIFLEMN